MAIGIRQVALEKPQAVPECLVDTAENLAGGPGPPFRALGR